MSNVRDTVTLAHKFVHLLGKCGLWRPSGAGRVRGQMLEPYAVKAARTVLRGGKLERAYLSQLETQVVPTINTKKHIFCFFTWEVRSQD